MTWPRRILKCGILCSLILSGCSIAIMTYVIANLLFSQSSNDAILYQLLLPCLMILLASVLLWSVNTIGNQGLYYLKHHEKATFFTSRFTLVAYLILNSFLTATMIFVLFLAVNVLSNHEYPSNLTYLYHKFVADTFNIFFFTTDTNGTISFH